MSDKSKIEWTDATWSPVRGCTKVSAGCDRCYAMRQAHRLSGPDQPYAGLTEIRNGRPAWTNTIRLVPEALEIPLHWKKPRRIFVCSMSDLFHKDVPHYFLRMVFAVMERCPQHKFQVLTKRPECVREYMSLEDRRPLPNVWFGTSVEDQATADARIPILLDTPAALRFVSYEPALAGLALRRWLPRRCGCPEQYKGLDCPACHGTGRIRLPNEALLDWVIAGGESGPGARPPNPQWFRDARDQCAAAGVPFHFKQWGEWELADRGEYGAYWVNELGHVSEGTYDPMSREGRYSALMRRVGKHAAGRTLDGRTHDEVPE